MKGSVVVKIGGSNLKSIESIQSIIDVLKAYDSPPIVVVSAFFGVTNRLIKILNLALSDAEKVNQEIHEIKQLKEEAISYYIEDKQLRTQALGEIDKLTAELRKYIYGINYIGEIPDFLYDKILSYGERLSATTLNAIFNAIQLKCIQKLPNDIGLITNGELSNANIDFEASKKAVSDHITSNCIVIVPGFYGISPDGKVNLLGRGGTDYAAASIARLYESPSLDIWKDVNGFLSVDPKIIKQARALKHLSYEEAAELAYLGAKILHPRTVEPLIDVNIPIRLFNIEAKDIELKPLTVIDNQHTDLNSLKSISGSDQFGVLRIHGPGLGVKPGILSKISEILYSSNINIHTVISSHIAINLLIEKDHLLNAKNLIHQLNLQDIQNIEELNNLSVIALVGKGILKSPKQLSKIFESLAKANIEIELSTLGASDVVCYLLVKNTLKIDCIRNIHHIFFK